MRFLAFLGMLLVALPAAAQEGLVLGDDVYRAGSTVVLAEKGAQSVFLAGERVAVEAGVAGSAHLAGRRVEVAAPVAGSLYAAGLDIALTAPVAGDATIAGRDIAVTAALGGSLRAAGATLRVTAPVAGNALLVGDSVTLDAPVTGDVALAADDMNFGSEARIDGKLVLLGGEDEAATVPARVVPPERTEVRRVERPAERPPAAGVAAGIGSFLAGIAILALLATLAASIAPVGIEALRDEISLRPFRTFGLGFLALAALVGSGVIIGLTVVGLLIVPAIVLATLLIGFAGCVTAVYMLGSSLYEWRTRREPDRLGARALAALAGAVVAGLVFLVPFLGWLFMLGLVITGTGALARAAFGSRIA